MLLKPCTQYASKFGKLSSGHRTGKGQFPFQSQRKEMPKNAQTTAQSLISHVSKVMFKILQARRQQYMNHELPDVQVGFRKGRGTRDQIANILWIIRKRVPYPFVCWCGRRRGWDVSREQHQNMYIIKGETDHQPRLDVWNEWFGLVHWEDAEG